MTVQVLLFAQARDIAGQSILKLDLQTGASIATVKAALRAACPDLSELIPFCMFSVDQSYAGDDDLVTAESEIGCIPPVSGG
jgi:sulfur-carrier protein